MLRTNREDTMAARVNDHLPLLNDDVRLIAVVDPSPEMEDRRFFAEGNIVGGIPIVSVGVEFKRFLLDNAAPTGRGTGMVRMDHLNRDALKSDLLDVLEDMALGHLRGLMHSQGIEVAAPFRMNGSPHVCKVATSGKEQAVLCVVAMNNTGPRGEFGWTLDVAPGMPPHFSAGTVIFR
jgi:hypothetical protein